MPVPRALVLRAALVACGLCSALATPAMASTTIDLRGTYVGSSEANGSTYSGQSVIDKEDCSAGTYSGHGGGNGHTVLFTGTIDANHVTSHQIYQDVNYTADTVGTLSTDAQGRLVDSGTFQDSWGQSGSYSSTRVGAGPNDGGCATRPSATSVQCDQQNPGGAGADFSCTATVADASTQPNTPSTPTGTVTFALDPGADGSFPNGAICTLTASQSGPTAYCAVTYLPGQQPVPTGTQPPLSATYSGDGVLQSSTGRPTNRYGAPPPPPPDPLLPTPVGPTPAVPAADGCATARSVFVLRKDKCRNKADAVGRMYEIKGHVYRVDGDRVVELHKDDPIFVGDELITDQNSVAAYELLIGGRIGIKKGTRVIQWDEGEVRGVSPDGTVQKIALRSGGMWAKFTAQKEPLTIQTRGGVTGIKG